MSQSGYHHFRVWYSFVDSRKKEEIKIRTQSGTWISPSGTPTLNLLCTNLSQLEAILTKALSKSPRRPSHRSASTRILDARGCFLSKLLHHALRPLTWLLPCSALPQCSSYVCSMGCTCLALYQASLDSCQCLSACLLFATPYHSVTTFK